MADRAVIAKRYYEKHKEKILQKAREKKEAGEVRTYTDEQKERKRIYHKEWRARNKDKILNDTLLFKYGILAEDFYTLLRDQEGGCAICGTEECSSGKRMAVDHCHTTGKVRGILCGNCNKGLGCFLDSPDILVKAIKYLTRK